MSSTSIIKQLYVILNELQRKYDQTYKDLPLDKLYELQKEIEHVMEEIHLQEENEKYLKAMLEQEMESYSAKCDLKAMSTYDDFIQKPIKKGRIVPVDNEGEPIQELGAGKWVRK